MSWAVVLLDILMLAVAVFDIVVSTAVCLVFPVAVAVVAVTAAAAVNAPVSLIAVVLGD
jgi:hypothetical protein